MANKLVALFLMCIVVVAAFSLHEATPQADKDKFKSCFDTCKTECITETNHNSLCEVKCENECEDKEHAGN